MKRTESATGQQTTMTSLALGATFILLGLLGAAPVAAQHKPGEPAPAVAAQAEPARDLSRYKEEPVPGGALLVVAYGMIWLLVAGFVARLVVRQSKLESELRSLQDRLDGEPRGGRS